MGGPTSWADIDDYLPVSGIAFIYPSDFHRLSPEPASGRWMRHVVPLEVGQGVQATHYLAWPTAATKQHLSYLESTPGTVEVTVLENWEPWSVIHIVVTEPGVQRQRPDD